MCKRIHTIVFLLLFSCVYINARAQDTLQVKNSVNDTMQVQKKCGQGPWKIILNPSLLWVPYGEIHLGVERNMDSTYMLGLDAGWSWMYITNKINNYVSYDANNTSLFIAGYLKKYTSFNIRKHPFYIKPLLFYRYDNNPLTSGDTIPTYTNYLFIDPEVADAGYKFNPDANPGDNYSGIQKVNTFAFEFLFGQDDSPCHAFYFSWYAGMGFRVEFKQWIYKAKSVSIRIGGAPGNGLYKWVWVPIKPITSSPGVSWVVPTIHAGVLIGLRFKKRH